MSAGLLSDHPDVVYLINALRNAVRERDEARHALAEATNTPPRSRVSALAQHYIDAQAAAGDAWRGKLTVAEDAQQRGIAYDLSRADGPTPAPPPPTVGELLARLPVVEWQDNDGRWMQASASNSVRHWRRDIDRWSWWSSSDRTSFAATRLLPARLVSADKADADPATRGPL